MTIGIPAILCIILAAFGVANAQKCRLQGICYALDNSGSISADEYEQIKNFTLRSSRNFAVSGVPTEYSAAWFTSSFGTIQSPTTDLEGAFVPTIQADTPRSGGTNIYRGLSACFDLLQGGGARAIVVVTDGQGASAPNPLPQIRADGVAVVSVGVGDGINEAFLRSIATKPEFYIPATFDMLPKLEAAVEQAACNAVSVIASPEPVSPPSNSGCQKVFNACAFTFEGVSGLPIFNIDVAADKPFTPRIVRKTNVGTSVVGVINSQGGVFQPVFQDIGKVISKVGDPKLSPTAFKTYSLKNGGSAIGHETFQGNQLTVSRGRCVVVYFQSWQVLNAKDGVVLTNINLAKRDNSACVAFGTSP